MSVATRPCFSHIDSDSWCKSPNSSFVFRDKEYTSATRALDEYITDFDHDDGYSKSWSCPNGGANLEDSLGCRVDDVYDRMLKAVKSGKPDGMESPSSVSEVTIANVSKLPSTPLRQKDDDAETTITDLLTDGPGSRSLSRGSPVGHSSSGGSSGKKTPERSATPGTTRSHHSRTTPRAKRCLDSPLKRSSSPFIKLHPDVPVNIAREPSPLGQLKLPLSPLKQAEDSMIAADLPHQSAPSWVDDLDKDNSSIRDDGVAGLSSRIPTWVKDLDATALSSLNGTEKLGSFLDSSSSTALGSEHLRDMPKWLHDMDTSDVTAVLNLIDKQLKNKTLSDSLSTISASFLSDDGVSSRKAGFDKRTSIPGRKIFWDANDSISKHNNNRLLTLNEKDKIRQRLVNFDDHNSYRLKKQLDDHNIYQLTKQLETLPHRRSSASISDDSVLISSGRKDFSISKSRDFVPRSKSVERLGFNSAQSVSDISGDTDYLLALKPPIGRSKTSSMSSLNNFDSPNRLISPRGQLGSKSLRSSSASIGPRRDRMSEFKISKLLTPPAPRKPMERTRSMSAYDEFKMGASRAGRMSSPVKYKSMFLDDTSVHTSRKSPRSERADKMIRDALAMPLLTPLQSYSNTSADTNSLLNAKVTSPSFTSTNTSMSYSTAPKVNLLNHNQLTPNSSRISGHPPGSMEALKNMLFTMQTVASSSAELVDGKRKVEVRGITPNQLTSFTAETSTGKVREKTKEDFENEVGGQVLQKAFMHLSKLKSLVSEETPAVEDVNTSD